MKINRALILFAALLVIPAVPAAGEELASLQADFLRGDYGGVVQEVRRMDRQGMSLNDGALYLWGVSSLKLNQTEEGRLALQRLMTQYPSSRWRAQSRLALGQSWEDEARDEEALKVYEQLAEEDRSGPYFAQALLRVGKVQMRLGQWQESKSTLELLVSRLPQSQEAVAAKDLLRQGTFFFCVQVGSFSAQGNAEKLAAEMKRRGYAAEVSEGLLQGKTFYRVRVGRFSSRDQAEQELQRLKQEGFPGRIFP